MRTRREQVSALACALFNKHTDIDECIAIANKYIQDAEERGFKRYQLKKTDHTAIDGRPSIKQWQHDQEEYFDPTIIEIVEEYAAWRDKQEAECAADTRRIEYFDRYKTKAISRWNDNLGRYEWSVQLDKWYPTFRPAIDAAMESGK